MEKTENIFGLFHKLLYVCKTNTHIRSRTDILKMILTLKSEKKNGRILQTTHTKSLRKTVLPQFFDIPVRLRPVNRTQHIYLTRTPVGGMDMGHMGHRDTVQRYIRPGTGTGNPVRQRGGRLPMARIVPYVPDIPPPHLPVPYRNIRLVYICFGMDTAGQYMDISRFGWGIGIAVHAVNTFFETEPDSRH